MARWISWHLPSGVSTLSVLNEREQDEVRAPLTSASRSKSVVPPTPPLRLSPRGGGAPTREPASMKGTRSRPSLDSPSRNDVGYMDTIRRLVRSPTSWPN